MLRYELIFVAGCQVLAPVVELPQANAMDRREDVMIPQNHGVVHKPQAAVVSPRIWLETLPFDDTATNRREKGLIDDH